MVNIIIVDFRDEVERRQAYSKKLIKNKKILDKCVENGYTQFGYDLESGLVVFAVERGNLIYVSTDNINMKNINELD